MIRAIDYINTLLEFEGRYASEWTNTEALEKEETYMRAMGIGGAVLNNIKSSVIPIDFEEDLLLWFEDPEQETTFVLKYPKEKT